MKSVLKGALWAAVWALSSLAHADTWPSNPIHIVVPYSAGGAVDIITRLVGDQMSKELGQPVIVETKPGGEGSIAARAVARAKPDGYTLLSSSAVITSTPLLFDNLDWGVNDFVGIGRFATSSGFVISSAKLPAQTMPEFVAYAKKHPGLPAAVLIGGAFTTFVTKMLSKEAGIDLLFVKYPGAAKHMVDLYEGRIALATVSGNLACSSLTDPHVKVLATTGPKRLAVSPNVPTTAEVGYPQVDMTGWYGFHAPAGTPQPVVDKLASALEKAMQTERVKQGLANACVEPAFMRGEEFDKFVHADVDRWKRTMKAVDAR